MKNLKIIIAILCVCLICIDAVYLLTKPQKTEQKIPAQTTKEVVFWSLQMGTFNNYMNPLIEQFEKENPDIKIKWIDVPYSEGEKRTFAVLFQHIYYQRIVVIQFITINVMKSLFLSQYT